jgi:hypothetical protein
MTDCGACDAGHTSADTGWRSAQQGRPGIGLSVAIQEQSCLVSTDEAGLPRDWRNHTLPALSIDPLQPTRDEQPMNATTWVLCSFALTFGVPIAFAGWELWRLGPTTWRPPPGEDNPPDPAPLPDAGVSPRIQKPLPDCLIPQAVPARMRELA